MGKDEGFKRVNLLNHHASLPMTAGMAFQRQSSIGQQINGGGGALAAMLLQTPPENALLDDKDLGFKVGSP